MNRTKSPRPAFALRPAPGYTQRVTRLSIFSFAVLTCLPSCKEQKPPAPARVARISLVEGVATQHGEQIVVGKTVALDEEIVIDEGRLEVQLSWAGTIRLFPHSRVVLADVKDTPRSDVRLISGRLWAMISGLGGNSFEIETPAAVAGVRGTEFVVDAYDERSEVYVVEGEVEVRSQAEPERKKSVRAKQRTRCTAHEAPIEPEAYEEQEHVKVWSMPAKAAPASWPASLPVVSPPEPGPEPEMQPQAPEPEEPTKKHKKHKKHARGGKNDDDDDGAETAAQEAPPPPPPAEAPPPAPANNDPKRRAFEFGKPAVKEPLNWPAKPVKKF